MTLVLDAGALLALERNDLAMWRRVKAEVLRGSLAVTHAGVLGQVWRGGRGRQANLARALPTIEIVSLDAALARRAGLLLAQSRTSDVIDAAVVALAGDDDRIVTSDPSDILRLVLATGRHIDVLAI